MLNLAWLIPILPLAAFLLVGLVPAIRQRPVLSGRLAILAVLLAGLLSLGALVEALGSPNARPEWAVAWLAVGPDRAIDFGFRVDPLTAVMLVIVTTVSFLVHVYSQGYLVEPEEEQLGAGRHHLVFRLDPGYARFFAFLALFTASMLGLVLASNLLTIYIFWELVGLCSYLLIGFWYHKPEAADAAKKAFVTTRFGDFGFLVGILLLWAFAGTLDFEALAHQVEAGQLPELVVTIGALLIFAGAVGKSAQFPLHVWLPDAMEGPTPVSALIHAATMVAAGVYLVARAFPIFEHSATAMLVVAVIGGFTAIFAATMALVQPRVKRVIAYSTISQLGYMMLALGAFAQAAGIFHLFTHAFFKALLFLAAGSIMHALHGVLAHGMDTEDLRNMGGLRRHLPVTYWTMLIGSLALAGVFPFSGFWSKDEVLAVTAASAERFAPLGLGWVSGLLLAFALITVFLTAFYSFRVIFLAFFGDFRGHARAAELGLAHGHQRAHAEPHESPPVMTIPLIVLAALSVVSGFWGTPWAPGFQAFVNPAEAAHAAFNAPLALLSLGLALLGIALAYAMYVRGAPSPVDLAARFRPIYETLLNRYYVDHFYGRLVNWFVLAIAWAVNWFDVNVVDGVVNDLGQVTVGFGARLRAIQSGRLPAYALAVFGGVAIIALATVVPLLTRG